MELNDALRRIVGQHWRLLGACLIAGVLVALLFATKGTTYSASTRLVLDTPDPASGQESAVIADTAKAIVTSPSQVRTALHKAGVERGDPVGFASEHVTVAALGTSGVLQLTVTDRDPRVAASVANALAGLLIRTRLAVTNGQTQQVLADLDRRTSELTQKISTADESIDSLNLQIANAGTPERANALRAKRDEAARGRDFLAQQRGVLESEHVTLLSTTALRPRPSVISAATPPETPDSSHRLTYLMLGALLGLIVGMGLAGLLETIRPTVVGSDALADELDAALLGTLPSAAPSEATAREIVARLRLAAEAADVGTVELFAAGPDLDLARLVDSLTAVSAVRAGQSTASGLETIPPDGSDTGPRHALRIRHFNGDGPSLNNGSGTGLVLVAPNVLKKRELSDAGHLLKVTNLPFLGVITYATPGIARPTILGNTGPAATDVLSQ